MKQMINSLEIAELMGKRHYQILEKIKGTKSTTGLFEILKEFSLDTLNYFIESNYRDESGKVNKCYNVTIDGVKLILDNTRNYKSKKGLYEWYLKNSKLNSPIILLNREEVDFINELEESLHPFGITGIKQYQILSYRIDYYIPELNIAIEFDEAEHSNYTYGQHEGRQKEIEDELCCEFIRVSNKNSNGYNIGLILKKLFYMAA